MAFIALIKSIKAPETIMGFTTADLPDPPKMDIKLSSMGLLIIIIQAEKVKKGLL